MNIMTTWALRLFGFSGIVGAIFFISGDLLYNHIPGSSATPVVKMSRLPEKRLLNAGTMGLIGCWLYILGSMHLYLAFRPAGEIFSFIILLAFGAVMICYGISHTAYFAIAAGAKVASGLDSDPEIGGKLGNAFFQRLVTITYVPVAISSLLMVYCIVTGESLYPWWMVFFLPVIIYLLKTPIVRILKGHFKELVNDSYDNVTLLVFFTLSTVILWNSMMA